MKALNTAAFPLRRGREDVFMPGRVRVFGPAYLDRILRVDRPLRDPPTGRPLDQSVEGRLGFGEPGGLTLLGPVGASIAVELPDDWPGPRGVVELSRALGAPPGSRLDVRAESWADDLGGMGAGFASAMDGEVVCALGAEDDPTSRTIERLLTDRGVSHRSVRVADQAADWTLLISSGRHEDKLAVGFRGCHAALGPATLRPFLDDPADVLIVAGLPNRLAAQVLKSPGPRLRVFAPAMRNALDREVPVLGLIAPVDVLCCNLGEWEALADREEIAARLSILVVTEGEAGSWARFTDPFGGSKTVRIPSFPRSRPPRDTNRAGEAFAACFLQTLLEAGWRPESCTAEVEAVRTAMRRASAAAALVLDRVEFGFAGPPEIAAALERGVVD